MAEHHNLVITENEEFEDQDTEEAVTMEGLDIIIGNNDDNTDTSSLSVDSDQYEDGGEGGGVFFDYDPFAEDNASDDQLSEEIGRAHV